MSFDTFLGWPTYPLLFTCSHCGETCDIDYAYEHEHCDPTDNNNNEKEEEVI